MFYQPKIKLNIYIIAFITLLLNGCVKFWLGTPELGSKALPIEFYLDNSNSLINEEAASASLQSCIEDKTGYRIHFNFVPDEKAVISALARGNAQFGVMSSMGYISASTRTSLKSVLIFSKKGIATTRSVILGKSSIWKTYFQKAGLALNQFTFHHDALLPYFNNSTVAFIDPENIIGFYLPRMYFLQRNIFPNAAIFVGSYNSVLDSLNENLATIGVVSENFIDTKFPNSTPIKLGSQFSDYIVLGISQNLPGNVITANQGTPNFVTQAIMKGFDLCSQSKASDFRKIFDADGVLKSNEKQFIFTKELYNFQQENTRILTQRN
jgi:ABC-type phosphate/phosphonate transport system substrate-binding protein